MIEHTCENCEHQKIKKFLDGSAISECDYGYNTYVACQCACVNDCFESIEEINKIE